MVDNILISIIIPTYNRAHIIGQTIKSLQNQIFKDYEIIVVDDGGKDNTKMVIEEYNDNRIRYYWKENAERGAARNFGAKLAKGKFLNFFDSDDIAYDNHLKTANDFISLNPSIVAFHTSYDWKDTNLKNIGSSVIHIGELNKKIYKNNICSCNNVFIRKQEFDNLKFSEERILSGTEDWLLWLQIACRYSFIGLKNVTSSIIQHDQRSMILASGDSTLARAIVLEHCIYNDEVLCNHHTIIKSAIAEVFFLSALFFSIEKKRTESIKFGLKALKLRPTIVFTKRTLAILKYLIF